MISFLSVGPVSGLAFCQMEKKFQVPIRYAPFGRAQDKQGKQGSRFKVQAKT